MNKEAINASIARVIVSTVTKKRQFSIFEVAEDIKFLKDELGDLQKVSKLIGISSGMLNQFLSVYKLPNEIIEKVKSRKIDSVSTVYYLSKFNIKDINDLVNLIIIDGLSSHYLRILLPYKKNYPEESIRELIKRINSSKNIKVSVIRFSKADTQKSISLLKGSVINLISEDDFLTIEENESSYDLKVTAIGEKKLREIAKKNNQSFQEFMSQLIK